MSSWATAEGETRLPAGRPDQHRLVLHRPHLPGGPKRNAGAGLGGFPGPVDHFDVHPTGAETRSVLHYASGTTGQPEGASRRLSSCGIVAPRRTSLRMCPCCAVLRRLETSRGTSW